ncbi:MAG: B12-binding domain-containing radical SAM protein [Proteobacteria bacterium]|nr:B12-binding domain-containing radical SAM protein [Pseudomonadota bacterium]
MKALLIYPELPPSFWSFPQATRFMGAKAMYAPLGLLTVAAFLPEVWDIRVVDLNVCKLKDSDWEWSDIILVSGMIVQRTGLDNIIKEARKRSKLTVAGGPYPTLTPDEVLANGCDFVVRGEVENAIAPLLACINSGKSGQIIEINEKPDISTSRLPRYDLVDLNNYDNYSVQTTRGCPFSCEFCDIAGLYGKLPRFKSPDQVVAELEHLYQLGARGTILVADDNFIANANNAKAICRKISEWNKLRQEPFGFLTQASINLGQDLEMIDLMTAANFGEIFIGIESPDEAVLTANKKHHNVTNPLLQSIENIKTNGLSIIGSFIIGFDNEKEGAGKRICHFIDQTNIPIIMPNILAAPPGTKLWQRLIQEDRLLPDATAHHSGETIFCLPNFIPTRPVEEIMEEYIEMWEYLYTPSRFFERTYKFCLAVRPTRRAMALSNSEPHVHPIFPKARKPPRKQFGEILIFLHHIWAYGVLSSCRVQFWKQLIRMRRHNPSRIRKYIIHCILGEELIQKQKTIRQKIYALMKEADRNTGIR